MSERQPDVFVGGDLVNNTAGGCPDDPIAVDDSEEEGVVAKDRQE